MVTPCSFSPSATGTVGDRRLSAGLNNANRSRLGDLAGSSAAFGEFEIRFPAMPFAKRPLTWRQL
jgi:hypothetical protein